MTDRLTQFQWRVADAGYRILPATLMAPGPDDLERLYLTNTVSPGTAYPAKMYSPASGLFRSFAELKPEQNEIIEFANRWGTLTDGVWILTASNSSALGEPLDLWMKEIEDLSLAFRIWELIMAGNTSGLAEYFTWKDASSVSFSNSDKSGFNFRSIASRESDPNLFETLRSGDLIRPAWYQLQHLVDEKIQGCVSERLLWNTSQTRLSLYRTPKDLISALWLQLARALEGDRKYQQCEDCRNWFEVSSSDGGRKDKRFCSTACRARLWRKTKKSEK